jgi:hypothetical protein
MPPWVKIRQTKRKALKKKWADGFACRTAELRPQRSFLASIKLKVWGDIKNLAYHTTVLRQGCGDKI